MSGAESGAFERLAEPVRRWIWKRGWQSLRAIQEEACAPILDGERDLVLSASTASGKTEAAFLPIVSRILQAPAEGLQALYVSPLKALINDQHRRLSELCRELEVPVHRWHGDVDAGKKRAVLERPRGILQITPESLEALFVLRGGEVPGLVAHLSHVVVDELHAFFGAERGRHLQSLLHRVELAARRRIPRVGLSATLGDLALAARFLRPSDPERVLVLAPKGAAQELRLQLRGALTGRRTDEDEGDPARAAIAEHLFRTLRGSSNLVFAGSRRDVELYADALRSMCDARRVPNEFHPHHGSLSKELREALEARLQGGALPLTAVCTSTLEMGVDIGDVESVAQIGVPTSVAALRQRLGRSGRRKGAPAVLRLYVTERELDADSPLQDRLREDLVQAVAACELLIRGWCEPPAEGALHLSTLVQQVLSLIAQHGGVRADDAFRALCASGPFREVDGATFAALLRGMGARDLITQAGDGTLVVGLAGERLVDQHDFFSVFQTAEEFRLLHGGALLGSLPVDFALAPGALLIFAGRRWRAVAIDAPSRTVVVEPAAGGRPPRFHGGAGSVHDELRREMRRVLASDAMPAYLDAQAARLLGEAREEFARLGLGERAIVELGGDALLLPWRGDRVMSALELWLERGGRQVAREGLALRLCDVDAASARELVAAAVDDPPADAPELAAEVANLAEEKYDAFLPPELLARDHAARRLDLPGATEALRALARHG